MLIAKNPFIKTKNKLWSLLLVKNLSTKINNFAVEISLLLKQKQCNLYLNDYYICLLKRAIFSLSGSYNETEIE